MGRTIPSTLKPWEVASWKEEKRRKKEAKKEEKRRKRRHTH